MRKQLVPWLEIILIILPEEDGFSLHFFAFLSSQIVNSNLCNFNNTLFQVILNTYDDGGFVCPGLSRSPGCQIQCRLNYEPLSLGTFWFLAVYFQTNYNCSPIVFQLIALMIPFLSFKTFIGFVQNQNRWKVSVRCYSLVLLDLASGSTWKTTNLALEDSIIDSSKWK